MDINLLFYQHVIYLTKKQLPDKKAAKFAAFFIFKNINPKNTNLQIPILWEIST